MTGIRIAGTGRYVPPLTVDNNAFAAFLDTNDEWIRSRTGIVTRHISDGEPSWACRLPGRHWRQQESARSSWD